MMDDYNQRDKKGSAYPIDRVKNYTLKQLESVLYGTNTWNGWRDSIKTKYPDNSTKGYLNELFKNYK